MKKLTPLLAGAIALLVACNAHSAEPLPVFGLPLGGKLKTLPPVCPSDTDKSKVNCWVGKPWVAKTGERSGTLHFANPDALPSWAKYASFELWVSKDRVLDSIEVTTIGADDKHAIASSISSRFGLPQQTTLQNAGTSDATWSRPEIFIHMLCGPKCYIKFRSAAAQAAYEKEMAARKAVDAARPVSP